MSDANCKYTTGQTPDAFCTTKFQICQLLLKIEKPFLKLSMFNLNFFFDFLDKKLCYTQIPTKEKYLLSVM